MFLVGTDRSPLLLTNIFGTLTGWEQCSGKSGCTRHQVDNSDAALQFCADFCKKNLLDFCVTSNPSSRLGWFLAPGQRKSWMKPLQGPPERTRPEVAVSWLNCQVAKLCHAVPWWHLTKMILHCQTRMSTQTGSMLRCEPCETNFCLGAQRSDRWLFHYLVPSLKIAQLSSNSLCFILDVNLRYHWNHLDIWYIIYHTMIDLINGLIYSWLERSLERICDVCFVWGAVLANSWIQRPDVMVNRTPFEDQHLNIMRWNS